jgi:beta-N-acetylhexosaminidase
MLFLSRRLSRRSLLALAGLAATAAACGTGRTAPSTPSAIPSSSPAPSPGPVPSVTPAAAVGLDEKIGQMIMVGFRGATVGASAPVAPGLSRHLGGAALFDTFNNNIESPSQLATLTQQLQSLATPPPLLIATDEEGGQIARLGPSRGFAATLSEGELGRRDDLATTRSNAATIATMLRDAGINLDLAPVVDLNVNPDNPIIGRYDRSYSADPDVVTRHATAFIEALHQAGLLTTLKHFPGHGSSSADSHLGFVNVTDTWSRTELEPFRRIIAGGKADAVMTAHIFNASLDASYPATLSHDTVTGILREELGFDGVVLTDDMQMGAISQNYGYEAAVRLAVNAGVDVISIANTLSYDPDAATRTMDIIRAAVDAGTIAEARIDEAYRRITALKSRLG